MDNDQSGIPKKTKSLIWIGIAAALALIVGFVMFSATNAAPPAPDSSAAPSSSSPSSVSPTPPSLTPEGGVKVSGAKLKANSPELVVYLDFICPACQHFDMRYGETLQGLAADGDISLEYRPISMLDRMSTSNYSSRAMNSFACVAESSPEHAVDYINKLMDEQPKEGGDGLTDDILASLATSVGAPDITDCITDKKYRDYVNASSDKAFDAGLDRTPYVILDGNVWDGQKDLLELLSESGVTQKN